MRQSTEQAYQKLLKTIGKNIKKTRLEKKWTCAKMEDFGFEIRNYQRLESGKHSPSLYTLFKLARAFGVEVTDFFKD
jgi:transcriptional regulator with XRE-family HTH domain